MVGSGSVFVSVTIIATAAILVALTSAGVPGSRPARSPEESDDMEIIRTCNMTSPISLAQMNKVLINKQLHGTETDGFKCFLHCLYTKYNWMDDAGGFHLTVMKEVLQNTHLEHHVIEWILYKCSAIDSPNKCVRAYEFTECFWAETGKYPEKEEVYESDLDIFHY